MTLDTHPILQAIEADPLFGLGITLVTYRSAVSVQRRCGGLVLLNPVLVSVAVIVLILKFGGISYTDYMLGGQYINLLLGPATVALALPLYDNLASIRRSARAILPSVVLVRSSLRSARCSSAVCWAHLTKSFYRWACILPPRRSQWGSPGRSADCRRSRRRSRC
jgi:putative effector of murein hydrolase